MYQGYKQLQEEEFNIFCLSKFISATVKNELRQSLTVVDLARIRGVANGGAGGADCSPGHQKSGRRAKIGKGKKGERKEKRGKGREKRKGKEEEREREKEREKEKGKKKRKRKGKEKRREERGKGKKRGRGKGGRKGREKKENANKHCFIDI